MYASTGICIAPSGDLISVLQCCQCGKRSLTDKQYRVWMKETACKPWQKTVKGGSHSPATARWQSPKRVAKTLQSTQDGDHSFASQQSANSLLSLLRSLSPSRPVPPRLCLPSISARFLSSSRSLAMEQPRAHRCSKGFDRIFWFCL